MSNVYYTGTFEAPWGPLLKWISWGVVVVYVGLASFFWTAATPIAWLPSILFAAIVFVCGLFTVRGYELRDHYLYIQRWLWKTQLDLQGLETAYVEPEAFKRSYKTWGNGGIFSFTGYFRSKKLGSFRSFVTDVKRCVVMEIHGKKFVISPDSPEHFVEALGFPPYPTRTPEAPNAG